LFSSLSGCRILRDNPIKSENNVTRMKLIKSTGISFIIECMINIEFRFDTNIANINKLQQVCLDYLLTIIVSKKLSFLKKLSFSYNLSIQYYFLILSNNYIQ